MRTLCVHLGLLLGVGAHMQVHALHGCRLQHLSMHPLHPALEQTAIRRLWDMLLLCTLFGPWSSFSSCMCAVLEAHYALRGCMMHRVALNTMGVLTRCLRSCGECAAA